MVLCAIPTDMVERRAEVFARMSALKGEAGVLTEIFMDKVSRDVHSMCAMAPDNTAVIVQSFVFSFDEINAENEGLWNVSTRNGTTAVPSLRV